MKVYLAYAMDHDRWNLNSERRNIARSELEAIGCKVVDMREPTRTFNKLLQDGIKGTGPHSGAAKAIVDMDLQALADCDLLFLIYSKEVRKGAGCHGELTLAAYLNKPVVIWNPKYPMKKMPNWVFGCCHPKFMHKELRTAVALVEIIKEARRKKN